MARPFLTGQLQHYSTYFRGFRPAAGTASTTVPALFSQAAKLWRYPFPAPPQAGGFLTNPLAKNYASRSSGSFIRLRM